MLVGDPHQLPPLVRSLAARAGTAEPEGAPESAAEPEGAAVSLFERLARAHPAAQAQLGLQYRMNSDVVALSNAITYDGRLRCGSDAVARATLAVPARERVPRPRSGEGVGDAVA